MKILYGFEPDICIINPDILINFSLDVVLPQYFLTQVNYLKDSSFGDATVAANKIINSLKKWENTDLLLFQTNEGGKVYFIDETINYIKLQRQYQNIDNTNPIDRYLLSILYLSEIIEAKIVFLASSVEIIRRCNILNFDTITLKEFNLNGNSWLQPELLFNIQVSDLNIVNEAYIFDTSEAEKNLQIQWQDIKASELTSTITWIDTE